MAEYQLEIKQIVDYPRCRIYRQFIQTLIADRSIRTNNGGSGLFYFTVLCSYANFRTSYRRMDGISYTIHPGEWICSLDEMAQWFRCHTKGRALDILFMLQEAHLIQYTVLGRGRLVKYRIIDWRRHNTVLDYNCPCQKDVGFFFLPVSTAAELVSISCDIHPCYAGAILTGGEYRFIVIHLRDQISKIPKYVTFFSSSSPFFHDHISFSLNLIHLDVHSRRGPALLCRTIRRTLYLCS